LGPNNVSQPLVKKIRSVASRAKERLFIYSGESCQQLTCNGKCKNTPLSRHHAGRAMRRRR
jgi:hypothetical protein